VTIGLHWFLPTAGDGREIAGIGPGAVVRKPTLDYLSEVALAAERNGFDAVLTPTGTACEDAWIATAALIPQTSTLRFLIAFRPGFISPTLAAQQAAAFQRLSNGRVLLNIVTGGSSKEQQRFGDWLDHDDRYDRTAEFIRIVKGSWEAGRFDYEGTYYNVVGATVSKAPDPVPPIFFGGSSDPAKRVAAELADVWLMWGEPPDAAGAEVKSVRRLAEELGRDDLRFGIRLHVISRDRAADAWAQTERMLEAIPEDVAAAGRQLAIHSESVGQQRMRELNRGTKDDLVIAPNLWAGFGLVRPGAGTALVGSHEEVAERIAEYHALGFDHFILSGQPHVEEAYWFGEGVMPLLRKTGLL
jgi:alkanesulfonate monooxygenase